MKLSPSIRLAGFALASTLSLGAVAQDQTVVSAAFKSVFTCRCISPRSTATSRTKG
jgi:hypothetical protein